jgi:hypothetical protein
MVLLHAQGQTLARDSVPHPLRAWAVGAGAAVFTAGSLVALDHAWYQGYERTGLHFFNDGAEWYQVDKLGHAHSAYQLGRAGHASFRWAGMREGTATWVGGSLGLAYLTGVEYLDGRSAAWGFSGWDMLANTAGAALFIGQQRAWGEQRILLKWSARLTEFAPRRPDLLGNTTAERLLKDYNGTTVWLSANARSLGWRSMPCWLNLAVGMGAEGMLGAEAGPDSYRQWYLAPDVSFSRIPVRGKALRTLFFLLDAVKLPAPAVEYRGQGEWRGHWLGF